MPITPTKYIWFNGELVPWEKATVHVMTHALHYGSSVFEGIRVYKTPNGAAGFRLTDHLQRLYHSAKIYRIKIPFSLDTVVGAVPQPVLAAHVDEVLRQTAARSPAQRTASRF